MLRDPGPDECHANGANMDDSPPGKQSRIAQRPLPVGSQQELSARKHQAVLLHMALESE